MVGRVLPYPAGKVTPHLQSLIAADHPLELGRTLEAQIGGQLRAGLVLTDLYEDRYPDADADPLSRLMSTFIATRAIHADGPPGQGER